MQEPLVSVLMNCYNGEKYLREAIDSVISQTYENWELIFWDNQSIDNSADILKSYDDPRLKYYLSPKHTNLGGGRAMAFQYLDGDFIAVLDVDDVWFPEKLEKQLPLFDDPEVGIVISDTIFFNENREKILYGKNLPPTGWVFDDLLANYFVSLETLVFRRSMALKLRRAFDPDFSHIADFDLVVRLSRISKLALYPEALGKWRIHENSGTWTDAMGFVEEKDRWITKQINEDPVFYENKSEAIRGFCGRNVRSAVIQHILNGRSRGAIKCLMQSEFNHWHAWVLLVLCLLPCSKIVLSLWYRKKIELIW